MTEWAAVISAGLALVYLIVKYVLETKKPASPEDQARAIERNADAESTRFENALAAKDVGVVSDISRDLSNDLDAMRKLLEKASGADGGKDSKSK